MLEILRRDLADGPERELCGLLTGTQNVVRFRVPALFGSWRTGFHLDQHWLLEQLYEARVQKVQILGFYHSHPQGHQIEPSQGDLDGHPLASKVLIFSADQGRFEWGLFEFCPTEDGLGFRRLKAWEV